MPCPEKLRLLDEYYVAVSEWFRVTEQLNARPYAFIECAKELRDVAAKVKVAYNNHKSEHGCKIRRARRV